MSDNLSTEVEEPQDEEIEEESTEEDETATTSEEPALESEDSFMGEKFDPKSLKDPKLIAAYKNMQAQWTKKNQSISEIQKNHQQLNKWRKDLESNPYFQSWARDMANMAKQQQQQQYADMPEDQRISYLADQRVRQILDRDVNPRVQNLEAERAMARVEKFLADNPEAKNYSNDIAKIMKAHPTLDLTSAWKFVQADTAKDKAKEEIQKEISLKGKANLELPGRETSQPKVKKKMTVAEALELAERQTGFKL